ncbi:carbon storage regulator [Frigoriglobus tundricola]|uniref:Translational regulator CsrA n=1 Tax=Frigoriglobus tundricola TaxID=2774151 RepID=A0A6M5YN42_9BACT|nr:carbon storage regulator [Frigoriglobus tundricola]QJW94984.1 hypothetical protein FTUN_2510 [Frigoriglobus tundricola]
MLVLTRRAGEAITIQGGIVVTVVGVAPGRVKIGIEAPSSVTVDRQDVHEQRPAAARIGEPPHEIDPGAHAPLARGEAATVNAPVPPSADTDIVTRAEVRAALVAARATAARGFETWESGYASGVRGEGVERLLRRLRWGLGRALRAREERDVRRGYVDGSRDRVAGPDDDAD